MPKLPGEFSRIWIRIRGLGGFSLNDFGMFRCRICGSMGLNAGICGVCGGAVREIREDPSGGLAGCLSRRGLRPFWTVTKIVATMVVVVVAVSSVGVGMYLSVRSLGPSCSNRAMNYPSCNTCSSLETYTSSTNSCSCANNALNPPSCNRYCANNAVNPPTNGNSRGCDLCPDGHTDIVCPPGLPPETYKSVNSYRFEHTIS